MRKKGLNSVFVLYLAGEKGLMAQSSSPLKRMKMRMANNGCSVTFLAALFGPPNRSECRGTNYVTQSRQSWK